MDQTILVRKPDVVLINEKDGTCYLEDFAVPADHHVKMKENEKIDIYLDVARQLKKLFVIKIIALPIVLDSFRTVPKEAWRVENRRTNRDHPNYSTGEIGHNTVKSPGKMRRFPVLQTLVKDHMQKLVWKTRKEYDNNNNTTE